MDAGSSPWTNSEAYKLGDRWIPVPLPPPVPSKTDLSTAHGRSDYGRLRDTYERAVEEIIFHDIVQRGADRIETMKLRYVQLSDALAIRFHDGMTKANTYSHDNPAAETVQTPDPSEFDTDIADFEKLIGDLKAEQKAAEKNRPSMKPK